MTEIITIEIKSIEEAHDEQIKKTIEIKNEKK